MKQFLRKDHDFLQSYFYLKSTTMPNGGINNDSPEGKSIAVFVSYVASIDVCIEYTT